MAKSSSDSTQQYKALAAEIATGKFKPVYFLMGEESYYIDKVAELLEASVLTEAEKGFNLTVLYGRDVSGGQVASHCRKFPMMAKYQLVLIKEAQSMKDTEALISYFEKPLESTVAVFCWKSDKVDKRTKFFKSLAKCEVFESNAIPDYKLETWLKTYAAERKLKATPAALQLLADHIGPDLARIAGEVDKMLINKPGGEITEEDVKQFVGISKEFSVFELQSALARKNMSKVLKIINHFANDATSKSIIPVLAGLYGFYSKLYAVLHEANKSSDNLRNRFGIVSISAQQDMEAATKQYSRRQAEAALQTLLQFDLMSKGINAPGVPETMLLRELMVRLMA